MYKTMVTGFLIEDCRRELDRLRRTLVQFDDAIEAGKAFLTGCRPEGARLRVSTRPGLGVRIWPERAEQARLLARNTSNLQARRQLLDVAESYDRLGK